jgi:hypothetical protein
MHSFIKQFILSFILSTAFASTESLFARQDSVTVIAGAEYKKSLLHKIFWGKNRRKEWTTPVRVPAVLLDTMYGGLKPYKKGGGNESKTLRLVSAKGKEYVIRSINKSRQAVIPKLLRNSYFGMIIQDGVSMSYPYGGLAVHVMMNSTGIYHSHPKLVYIPSQRGLDTFNHLFGDDLYLLEERPEGNWSDDAPHLGNFRKFYSTKEVFDKMREDSRYKADQFAFIKSRLFDILLADWDRNHDNWRWGVATTDTVRFIPIARDRDQAFFTRNGIMMALLVPLMKVGYMQNFDHSIKNVGKLTKQDRLLDEIFTNEMSLEDWQKAAKQLSESLNDSVIIASVSELPPEIFSISGNELVEKLKNRRTDLPSYAAIFYKILARDVKITGTTNKDIFRVRLLPDGKVSVEITAANETSFYKRVFSPKETNRITLSGFGGDDVFEVDPAIKSIKVIVKTEAAPAPAFKEKGGK